MLGYLLETAADSEGGLSKDGASDEILSDVLLTLLFAGYDTTSVSLAYALYQISQYPDIETLCLEENDSVPSLDQIDDFVYCRAVLQETLRLFPAAAAAMTRSLQKAVRLRDGFTIPKDTNVFIAIWFIHRDERNFACPEEFRLDRWVHREEASSKWKERDCDDTSGSVPAANRSAFFSFSAIASSHSGPEDVAPCCRNHDGEEAATI